jgi:hypothetical protein
MMALLVKFVWPKGLDPGAAPRPWQPSVPVFASLGELFLRTPSGVTIHGYMPVMFMCFGLAILVFVVSLLTKPPAPSTLAKYFSPHSPVLKS